MKQIRLGRTELKVSRIGFGGIPIQRLTEEQAVAVVKRCLEREITFLDTANGYTSSEERIGKAIAGQREKLIIATKTHSRQKEELEKNLKLSLERLKTDYIDIYQFHGVSTFKDLEAILAPGGLLETVEAAKKAGVVRHIGITSHQIDVAKKAVESDRFESIMFPFNFMSTEVTKELLPLAKKHDVGFIAMKPMAGGMVDNAAIAFKYLLQFPEVLPIVGIEKTAEIDEIAKIIKGSAKMTAAELEEMEHIRKELGTSFCHRCDYCQPCTAKIAISTVMTAKSNFKRSSKSRFFGGMGKSVETAVNCTDCGKCEERCPYHLPIRKMLQEQLAWYKQEQKKYEAECQNL